MQKFLTRIKSAWLVLIGKKFASKYPEPGLKRKRRGE